MLLEMSIHASLLVVFIALLRRSCWLPKRLFVILWDIALARLLIPGMIEVHLEMPWQQPAGQSASAAAESSIWIWIWLTGFAATAVCMAHLYIREYRMLRESLPPSAAELSKLARCLGADANKVRISDRIQTPVAFGLWKPKIVLPKTFASWTDEEAAFALQHELVHLDRLDNLQKAVMAAALCVHWFNPLVWIMHRMLDRDIERACDEKVIAWFGEQSRAEYANALLDLASRQHYWSVYGSGFGRSAIHERINSMMKHKRITVFAVISTIIVLAIAATAFAQASPEAQPDWTPSTEAVQMESTAVADDGNVVVYDENGGKVEETHYSIDIKDGKIMHDGKEIGIVELNGEPDGETSITVTGTDEDDLSFSVVAEGAGPDGVQTYRVAE